MNDKELKNDAQNEKVNIIIPAVVFFAINTIVLFLQDIPNLDIFSLVGFLIGAIISNLISQVLAYLTCRFLVVKRNKGQQGVWINYIIWILIMNLGVISEMISK